MKVAFEITPRTHDNVSLGDDVTAMEYMMPALVETARLDSEHGKLDVQMIDVTTLIEEAAKPFHHQRPNLLVKTIPNQITMKTCFKICLPAQ